MIFKRIYVEKECIGVQYAEMQNYASLLQRVFIPLCRYLNFAEAVAFQRGLIGKLGRIFSMYQVHA